MLTLTTPFIPLFFLVCLQMMFAAITPLLMTGAFAERLHWNPYLVFIFLWELLVYYPVAHWVWGGGWLADLGTVDFAGAGRGRWPELPGCCTRHGLASRVPALSDSRCSPLHAQAALSFM